MDFWLLIFFFFGLWFQESHYLREYVYMYSVV